VIIVFVFDLLVEHVFVELMLSVALCSGLLVLKQSLHFIVLNKIIMTIISQTGRLFLNEYYNYVFISFIIIIFSLIK
jgi:hypothetical protein